MPVKGEEIFDFLRFHQMSLLQKSFYVIPEKTEILLRVIILQLVCLLSVNRGEVIVVTAEMSN